MVAITSQAEQFAASTPDKEFHDFLAQGRFMIQRSRLSGKHVFPPRVAEPGTGARHLEWVEASGRGTLYSFTFVSRRNPDDGYNIVLVELAEGPRILSTVEGLEPDNAFIGMAVRARIVDGEAGKLLIFVPDRAEDVLNSEKAQA